MGYHERTGTVLALADKGCMRGKSISRQSREDAWDVIDFEKLKGLPWEMVSTSVRLPRPVTADKEAAGPPLPARAERAPEVAPRRRYVLAADIEEFGETAGCPGCLALRERGTTSGRSHNEECRSRIGELLERRLEGKARMDADRSRMKAH